MALNILNFASLKNKVPLHSGYGNHNSDDLEASSGNAINRYYMNGVRVSFVPN